MRCMEAVVLDVEEYEYALLICSVLSQSHS
jgi:hypothetical protein